MSYIQNPNSSKASPFAQMTWTSSTTFSPDTSSQTWCTAGSASGFTGSGFVSGIIVLSGLGVGSFYIGSSTSRYQFGQFSGSSGAVYGQTYATCEPSAVAYGNPTRAVVSSSTGFTSSSLPSSASRINVMRIES